LLFQVTYACTFVCKHSFVQGVYFPKKKGRVSKYTHLPPPLMVEIVELEKLAHRNMIAASHLLDFIQRIASALVTRIGVSM
jgi:hypothetical protein